MIDEETFNEMYEEEMKGCVMAVVMMLRGIEVTYKKDFDVVVNNYIDYFNEFFDGMEEYAMMLEAGDFDESNYN